MRIHELLAKIGDNWVCVYKPNWHSEFLPMELIYAGEASSYDGDENLIVETVYGHEDSVVIEVEED